ncbi:MAG: aminoglycoside phosphotransferase family protein [Bacteroidota bacterium]
MENIIRQFFEFDKIETCQPFGNGHINDTYKIELIKNELKCSYLLQRFNHQIFKRPFAVMENIGKVSEYLLRSDYPLQILRPYKNKKDEWLYIDQNQNYWRIFNFIEDTVSFDKIETVEQAYEGARTFAVFAKAFSGFDVSKLKSTIPGFHNGETRLINFENAVENARPKRKELAKKIIAEIFEQQLFFKKINRLKLPLRVIHHDTKINNILFKINNFKAVAVVDLDTVMPGVILSDFGDMVRTFTNSAEEDEKDTSKVEMRKDIYRAVEEGFLSEVGAILSEEEKRYLKFAGPWLTLMQSMRFLGDYLTGDVYYKTKYPAHNLVRAKSQLALFRSMQGVLS